jgi:hypothetical protein
VRSSCNSRWSGMGILYDNHEEEERTRMRKQRVMVKLPCDTYTAEDFERLSGDVVYKKLEELDNETYTRITGITKPSR